MAATFSWKPALVGSRCEVRVDRGWAEATQGSKSRKVRFADVRGGRLLELNMRTSSVSLVLMHKGEGGDAKFVINHGGRIAHASHDENAAGFVAAASEILEAVAQVKPGLQLDLGGGPGVRWTMAGLGAIMAVIGALLALVPFGEGRFDFDGIAMIVMAVLIVTGGAGLAMRYNPLVKLPTASAAEIARVMRSHLRRG